MASLVLLMDVCHNKSSPRFEEQRSEIEAAIWIMEDARHDSIVAAKFLDCLLLVLRKHRVTPAKCPAGDTASIQPPPISLHTKATGVSVTPYNNLLSQRYTEQPMATQTSVITDDQIGEVNDIAGSTCIDGEDISSYFNELAQSDIDSYDWDGIFSGLGSSFL